MFSKRYITNKNVMTRIAKGKDISRTSNGRYMKQQVDNYDGESNNLTFPYVKPTDNAEVLPCYTDVLGRSVEDGVGMKDLDQLQQELEKLLSSCAVRNRLLLSEFEFIDKVEERHEKKGKLFEPPSPKFRKIEEKAKQTKDIKVSYKLVKNFHDELPKLEIPKTTMPKNDTKSKFWMSVDPYCAAITRDDTLFLDTLVQECSRDVDLKIPDLGSHYSFDWHNNFNNEQSSTAVVRPERSKNALVSADGLDYKKNGFVEDFGTSIILPLASALLEENVPKITSHDKLMKEINMRPTNKSGMCIDKRLRKELQELGILDTDDEQKVQEEDEIVKEITRCHSELVSLNENNKRELNRLQNLVMKDRACQELNEKLDNVDSQIMEVYNKLRSSSPSPSPKDKLQLEWEAVRIIQIQRHLHKEAMDISSVLL